MSQPKFDALSNVLIKQTMTHNSHCRMLIVRHFGSFWLSVMSSLEIMKIAQRASKSSGNIH